MKVLNSQLLRQIGTLSRSIHSMNDLRFKALHLQKGQYIYLTRICENPGINLVELTLMLRVDKTSTTKAIQKLEAEGYIERQKDSSDSRMLRLFPTVKGLEIYDAVIEEENRTLEMCLEDFSVEESEKLSELIDKLNENYVSVWKQGKYD